MLIIEDERRLADALAAYLKKFNFTVDVAYDGLEGQMLAECDIYDLIILDRMLPGKDGLLLLKELRAHGLVMPVLILTARDAVSDRVEGLDAGADDYLVKPFAMEELLARIKALSRRPRNTMKPEVLKVGSLKLDPLAGEAFSGSLVMKLTPKETQLLSLFMANPGQILTREQLFDRVWGLDTDVEANSIDTYIHYLRRKLKNIKSDVTIETVRGVGYRLREK